MITLSDELKKVISKLKPKSRCWNIFVPIIQSATTIELEEYINEKITKEELVKNLLTTLITLQFCN